MSSLAAVTMFAIALIAGGGATAVVLNSHYSMVNQTGQVGGGTKSASNSTFRKTLVITVNNAWNATISGPRYSVLTADGLGSSANLSLPAHTLIQLTIADYDSAPPLPAQYANVTGTVGNLIYVVNGTSAATNSLSLSTANAVRALNPNTEVGHTFTIPQLGINIPVAASSVEVANFYLNVTGSFIWHCEDPCGYGPSGWEGPMATNGWMGGTVTVS